MVLRRLKEEGFTVSVAYPGQLFPQVDRPVAAVHIEKVDRANLTVTLEVTLVSPASLGGTQCEMEALRASEVLRWSGAECIQNGCRYEGVAQVYTVSILATYTGHTDDDSCTIWHGFYCYLNEEYHRFCIAFQTEQTLDTQLIHGMGDPAAVGTSPGRQIWKLRLEELIPVDAPEPEEPEGTFELKIVTNKTTEIYSGCHWDTIQRQRTRQGLRRIRTGWALNQEVT